MKTVIVAIGLGILCCGCGVHTRTTTVSFETPDFTKARDTGRFYTRTVSRYPGKGWDYAVQEVRTSRVRRIFED